MSGNPLPIYLAKYNGYGEDSIAVFEKILDQGSSSQQQVLTVDAVNGLVRTATLFCAQSDYCQSEVEKIYQAQPKDALSTNVATRPSKEIAIAVSSAVQRATQITNEKDKNQIMAALDGIRQKVVDDAPDGFNPTETREIINLCNRIAPSVVPKEPKMVKPKKVIGF